jgi:hypothetical protein
VNVHVPFFCFMPFDAAVSQSLGNAPVTSNVPAAAAAQFAGFAPERISSVGAVPIVVSN